MQNVILKQPDPGTYRFEAVSTIKVNDIAISKLFTSTDFNIAVIEEAYNYTVFRIGIQSTYSEDNINGFNELLLNIENVKDELLLKIDNTGTIKEIINKDKLKQKWIQVRADLEKDSRFELLKPEDQKSLLKTGDDEYLNDTLSFINKRNTLYTVLFCGYLRTYEPEETYELKQQIRKSGLFKDEEIPLELYATLKRNASGNKGYQLEIQGIEDRKFDTDKLKSLYQINYPTGEEDFDDYSYSYSPEFEVDINTGRITKIQMTVLEQAGSILMFMDCTIEQLSSEKDSITHKTKSFFSTLKKTLLGG
jgi:hypothetical protein